MLQKLLSRKGDVLEEFTFSATSSRLRAFAEATRADEGMASPQTFLVASALDRSTIPHVQLGLDPVRVRHAEQSFRFLGPIPPDAELNVRVRLEDAFEREGRSGRALYAVVENEYRHDETLLAITRMTLVQLWAVGT